MPPSKNPKQLSNPILESLVMASFSLPRSQIRIILVLIFGYIIQLSQVLLTINGPN